MRGTAVLTKEQIESIRHHTMNMKADITPQIVGTAAEIIQAGRKALLARKRGQAAGINAAADYLLAKVKQIAFDGARHDSRDPGRPCG